MPPPAPVSRLAGLYESQVARRVARLNIPLTGLELQVVRTTFSNELPSRGKPCADSPRVSLTYGH